jgi:hypothetical protein
MNPQQAKRFILLFDSLSGLAAGCLVWVLTPLLLTLHNWSLEFAHFIAISNIGYGIFSGTMFLLYRKGVRVSPGLVTVLVAGNSVWALQCFAQTWRLWGVASFLGRGHLIFEGVYVGLLAYFEARIFLFPKKDVTG